MKKLTLFFFLSLFLNALELIEPIKSVPYDKEKAVLGEKLFFDKILSRDNNISCASCHKPSHGWADTEAISVGVFGRKGVLNSPTVLNAVFNFRQLWDGTAKNLQDQADGSIHKDFEMDMTSSEIEKRLNNITMYRDSFKKIYNTKSIQYKDVLNAIAEFEKTLITKNSKFDLFLQNKASLSKKEEQGYLLFKTLGCVTCHNGINIGGNSFQKIGIVIAYSKCDKDRYEVTKKEFDKCIYKVPTLRNIAQTAPYFHDGSIKTLQGAIKKMAHHNLGYEIKIKEAGLIESFLKTLSAKKLILPKEYIDDK